MLHRIFTSWIIALTVLLGSFAHAGDATSFNPLSVPVVAKSAGGVPVGTIIAWPVSRNPEDMDKWLECNGQSVSRAVYPELFAVLGGSVPDYRGLFLRGVGGNSAGLGQAQGDAIRNITGEIFSYVHPIYSGALYTDGMWHHLQSGPDSTGAEGALRFDASRVVPTANENRPVNKSVRYLIRAKP